MSEGKDLAHLAARIRDAGASNCTSERALLRRVYFPKPERSKYVTLGFSPDRGYRAFFALGGVRQVPLVLAASFVSALSVHLPNQCDHMLRGERYRCNEMSFRIVTVADDQAKVCLDRAVVTLGLLELEYLLLNLPTPTAQLERYRLGESDVREYVRRAAGSKDVLPPRQVACLYVQYDVLFQEINGHL
jgi:hypothetical protein